MENGQDKASALDLLDHCCQLVADTYGKPDSPEWTNSDFIRLSSILYKKTHVQISPNTLKRIFGKIKTDARYYPQKATRDALAQYVGFADWDRFADAQARQPVKIPQRPDVQPVIPPQPEALAVPAPTPRRKSLRRAALIASIALIIMSFTIWRGLVILRDQQADVTLFCKNPEGENPHSAVFVLRTSGSISELASEYVIEYGDSKKTHLNGKDSVYSHYYEVPGRYFAVLKKAGVPLDTVPVFLRTSNWTATANMMYDTTRVYPIETPGLFSNGYNSISAREIARAGVDTNRTFFVDFINTHISGIDGDNFELLVNVKASPPRPGVRCSQVRLTVYGDSSNHMVDIMKPGCVHWSKLQFSELKKDGRSEGPDFLGADLTAGGTITMKVVNRRATLLINGREAYKNTYQKALRHIYGLDIMFAGIGTVRSVQLKDLKTGKQFSGNF
ncbi:hypothetical protein [Dyadobacter sp. SG02]|uniref:hypothetical protein n=1 Tax=Dyadobacter sp. SG02 TaxID=1855291 RepID=UPI001E29440F|nr:hypothetical protein [Dyadobacter sp. SG02]